MSLNLVSVTRITSACEANGFLRQPSAQQGLFGAAFLKQQEAHDVGVLVGLETLFASSSIIETNIIVCPPQFFALAFLLTEPRPVVLTRGGVAARERAL